MALQTEAQHSSAFMISEANGTLSRENITILAGSGAVRALTAGMVLGKVSASQKYVQFDQDAVDGSQNAAGILLTDVTAPDGTDAKGAAIVRSAEVNSAEIVWPSDITGPEQTAAEAQLDALWIRGR